MSIDTYRSLDRRLREWRALPTDARAQPHGGWIRAVREALGMSATDLANRLEVSPAAVAKLEEGERRGATRLETLERAANAMDCDLVYALVPRESLEYTVRERARHVALNDFAALSHSMDLENQRLDTDASKDALESLIERALATRGLWKRERD